MIKLQEEFNKNEQKFKLIKRNDDVALFQLNGINSFEILRIYKNEESEVFGRIYKASETITSNGRFGLDGSGHYNTLERALEEYDILCKRIETLNIKREQDGLLGSIFSQTEKE